MNNVAVIDRDLDLLEHVSGLLGQNGHIASVICFRQWAGYVEKVKKGNVHIAFIAADSQGLHRFPGQGDAKGFPCDADCFYTV